MSAKRAASNRRFGKIAAVLPQKRQCEFGSYYPAGALVEAAASPSRQHVSGKRATVWWTVKQKRMLICNILC